jgi:hypothetical protein
MSDYYARLANCALHGIEFTTITKDDKPCKVRNLIRLNTAGFELELHQKPTLPATVGDLCGQCVDTTDLFVRDVAENQVAPLRDVISNVCDLLSFATESRVLPYYSEYPAGSGLFSMNAMIGTVQLWRYPFQQPEDVKHLIETCYDRYVYLRNPRSLHVAIEYIRHSVTRGLAEEVHIALACIAFENLRHNWALDSGYPHIDGFFREKKATAAKPGNSIGFRRHLDEMFAEVGMNTDSQRIVDTRNEAIHTGLYGDIQNNETYEFLETALREYFLRLIGYHGPFLPYTGGAAAPIVI